MLLFLALFAYGLLNVVTPRTTFAWQVRATARHDEGNPPSSVGKAVQQWLGASPDAPPDSAVLRRIRMLGLIEIAAALVLGAAFYASS